MPDASFPVVITDVTRSNLVGCLEVLRGCWKASSVLWMQANGFSVLSGVIVNAWTREAEVAVSRFCEHGRFTEFLLRIEKPGQRWTTRRGGYTIPVSDVGRVVSELADDGMLAMLLEPARPYSDVYSLGAVCDLHAGAGDIEIVGPGFDASDILRGDVLPQERLQFSFGASNNVNAAPRITQRLVVDADRYHESVRRRLMKIGAALRNPALPSRLPDGSELAEEAAQYLRSTGQTLLLDHAGEYEPIPESLLAEFVEYVSRLSSAVASARVPWRTLSIAASFLVPRRLVMWDFFAPNDYQTTLLSTILAQGR